MIDELIGRMAATLEQLQAAGDQRHTARVADLEAPGPVLLRLAATGFGVRLPAAPRDRLPS